MGSPRFTDEIKSPLVLQWEEAIDLEKSVDGSDHLRGQQPRAAPPRGTSREVPDVCRFKEALGALRSPGLCEVWTPRFSDGVKSESHVPGPSEHVICHTSFLKK